MVFQFKYKGCIIRLRLCCSEFCQFGYLCNLFFNFFIFGIKSCFQMFVIFSCDVNGCFVKDFFSRLFFFRFYNELIFLGVWKIFQWRFIDYEFVLLCFYIFQGVVFSCVICILILVSCVFDLQLYYEWLKVDGVQVYGKWVILCSVFG